MKLMDDIFDLDVKKSTCNTSHSRSLDGSQ